MIIFSSHGCYKSTVIFYHNKYGAETGQSGATNIVKLPLAFVRGGYVGLSYGQARDTGYEASTRSRTAKSSIYGYILGMNTTGVNPSYYNSRCNGFPLRCLYPGN